MLKYTTEEIVEKFRQVHENIYDYSKFEYLGNSVKSTIICKEHGEFLQRPKTHLLGQGCVKCGKTILHNKFKLTREEFIKKAIKIHGQKYDYSLVEYYNGNTNINIVCEKHGMFSQRPYDHLCGKGCYQCGRISLILNRKTHDFTKTRWCSLNQNKTVCFYCFLFKNATESFYKIGITNDLKKRHSRVKNYSIEIVDYIESEDKDFIWSLELKYKEKFRIHKYIPNCKFSGSNECYIEKEEILNQIKYDKAVCYNRNNQ